MHGIFRPSPRLPALCVSTCFSPPHMKGVGQGSHRVMRIPLTVGEKPAKAVGLIRFIILSLQPWVWLAVEGTQQNCYQACDSRKAGGGGVQVQAPSPSGNECSGGAGVWNSGWDTAGEHHHSVSEVLGLSPCSAPKILASCECTHWEAAGTMGLYRPYGRSGSSSQFLASAWSSPSSCRQMGALSVSLSFK